MAIIALGSNLGDSRQNVLGALGRSQALQDEPILRSSLWETTPVDCPAGSPRFINAVVGLRSRDVETPESLLMKLKSLEVQFGRKPKDVLNEPRPLDLDLIAFGDEMRASKELMLPHPRAANRRFVLAPLNEIAPGLILPGQSKTVGQLLMELSSDESCV